MIQNEFDALLRHISFCLKTEIFSQFSKKYKSTSTRYVFESLLPVHTKRHSY